MGRKVRKEIEQQLSIGFTVGTWKGDVILREWLWLTVQRERFTGPRLPV